MEINLDVRSDNILAIARAIAIQQYGNVEQSLSSIFALLLGISPDISGIVFFRITASWQRNQVLEDLLEKKFGTQYDTYWHGSPGQSGIPRTPGMFALLRQLDETRNQIVHWTTAVNVGIEGDKVSRTESLIPPNIWGMKNDKRELTAADLSEFAAKADFVSRSINMFGFIHWPNVPEASKQPWRDIFQRPCAYPPSAEHPLAPKPKVPDTPPQPSGA